MGVQIEETHSQNQIPIVVGGTSVTGLLYLLTAKKHNYLLDYIQGSDMGHLTECSK